MMIARKAFVTTLGVGLLMAGTSLAQEKTDMERIERRVMALEQKLYSVSPDEAGAKIGPTATAVADLEARLTRLEEESQKLYGGVEELGHAVEQMVRKMELIAKDMEMRLQDLERNGVATSSRSSGSSSSSPNLVEIAEAEKKKQQEKVNDKPDPNADPTLVDTGEVPSDLSPEDHYKKAYSYLTAASYDLAEEWLRVFLVRHPEHNLADNAHYWLGEIYLVKEQPERAIISFRDGLQAFPAGNKAPANLLKMGVAFDRIGQSGHATSAWKKLVNDFPSSPEAEKAKQQLAKMDEQIGGNPS